VSAYLQADRYALGERSRWKDDLYLWSDRGADDESVGADVVRLLADATDDGEVARQIGREDARHSTIIQLISALHLCTHLLAFIHLTRGRSNLTKRPHRRRTWTVQSYSPNGANVHPYLIHASLNPPESTSTMVSRLVLLVDLSKRFFQKHL